MLPICVVTSVTLSGVALLLPANSNGSPGSVVVNQEIVMNTMELVVAWLILSLLLRSILFDAVATNTAPTGERMADVQFGPSLLVTAPPSIRLMRHGTCVKLWTVHASVPSKN